MIQKFPTGIGNYRENLIKALAKLRTKHTFVLVGNRGNKMEKWCVENKGFDFAAINSRANSTVQHLLLPFELSRLNLDLFWTTPWGATLFMPCSYALTIYDLIYRRYPQYGSVKAKVYEKILAGTIARKAELIFVTSEFVKDDVVSFLQVDKEKVANISGAAGGDYEVINDENYVQTVLEKYNLEQPYFVYVGNMRPHKNLQMLLKAFARLKVEGSRLEDFKLVIIGAVDATGRSKDTEELYQLVNELGLENKVKFLGRVAEDKEVAAILNRAVALVHPSLHEGFGLTVLEAMSCGCPVITSKRTSIPEVAGSAAVYIDPADVESIAEQMERVAGLNAEERKRLEEQTLREAEKFSWLDAAEKVVESFNSLGAHKCSNYQNIDK